MKKKEYYSIADNVTVDIFDFLWNVLGQWKAILIIALIFSFLSVSMKYHSDMKAYNNAGVQTVTVESLEATMSKEEIDGVDYAVRQYRLIDKYEDYLDYSVLVDVDPAQLQVARISYKIADADAQQVATVQDAYRGFFYSESFLSGLSEMLPRESSRPYVSDLVQVGADGSTTTENSAMLCVRVILTSDMTPSDVTDYVQKQVTEYAESLESSVGAFTLDEVSVDVTMIADADALTSQSATIDNAFKLRNSQQQIREGFNENQTNLYNLKVKEVESDGDTEASITVTPEHPRFSKKVMVLGFVVGILMYVFVYLVLTLFKNKIKTSKECEDTLDIRTLGELHEFHSNGWRRLFTSKFVYGLKYREFSDSDLQEKKIVDSLSAYAAKNNDVKLSFTSVAPLSAKEEEHLNHMKDELLSRGIHAEILVGDIRKDTSFHQNLARANQMILVLCKGRSAYPDIDLSLELARESKMDIVGNVFVDC